MHRRIAASVAALALCVVALAPAAQARPLPTTDVVWCTLHWIGTGGGGPPGEPGGGPRPYDCL